MKAKSKQLPQGDLHVAADGTVTVDPPLVPVITIDPGPRPATPPPPFSRAPDVINRLHQAATISRDPAAIREHVLAVSTMHMGAAASQYKARLLAWIEEVEAWQQAKGAA